ncbi:hypothetical protein [Vibrio harveyi]|uniref:hypothetical protein n=1 Tax=Vibrio harveyi TaxID=669 RepID=UPI000411F1D9|nr:hypothetical protein [Vibrio harveyi]
MQGFTKKIQSSQDLMLKLKHDLERLKSDPNDVYAAFDFFVTAEHISEWNGDKKIRREHELLKAVSHLANSAKHFQVRDKRHNTVTKLTTRFSEPDIDGICVAYNGNEVSALSLAEEVVKFWASKLWVQG